MEGPHFRPAPQESRVPSPEVVSEMRALQSLLPSDIASRVPEEDLRRAAEKTYRAICSEEKKMKTKTDLHRKVMGLIRPHMGKKVDLARFFGAQDVKEEEKNAHHAQSDHVLRVNSKTSGKS